MDLEKKVSIKKVLIIILIFILGFLAGSAVNMIVTYKVIEKMLGVMY